MRKDSFSFFACSDNRVRIFNTSCFFPSFTSRVTITLVLSSLNYSIRIVYLKRITRMTGLYHLSIEKGDRR
jgi:hypothetical protein